MIKGYWDGQKVHISCWAGETRIWSMEQAASSPAAAEWLAMDYLSRRGAVETINWQLAGVKLRRFVFEGVESR